MGNITSGGNVTLAAGSTQAIANASVANGNVSGGDVVVGNSSARITAGAGNTVVIYSGNANTQNLSGLVANGSTS
ncbi:hypothetical protein, partial [Herbaspirillum rubrisubalbicans]